MFLKVNSENFITFDVRNLGKIFLGFENTFFFNVYLDDLSIFIFYFDKNYVGMLCRTEKSELSMSKYLKISSLVNETK